MRERRGRRLALFDLLASEDKTLHANPGGHLRVPRVELGGAAHFLRRRLGSANSGGDSTGDDDTGDSNGASDRGSGDAGVLSR